MQDGNFATMLNRGWSDFWYFSRKKRCLLGFAYFAMITQFGRKIILAHLLHASCKFFLMGNVLLPTLSKNRGLGRKQITYFAHKPFYENRRLV